jgi:nitrite reductase/ring-hydroxylating ferredoxin subunit
MPLFRAAKTHEIAPGQIREFQLDGHTVAIANLGGNFYAIENTCLHRGGPLGQGVTCPWHGWQFDVTSGKAVLNPAVGVGCFRTEVRGDDLFVEF